jgi:tetratricopeptide (TPR) repeat protein
VTTNWDAVVKQARECHTKQAWEAFFVEAGDAIATSSNSKAIQEVYKLLRADPQGLQYDPRIWGRLIQGCLSSWNLELGREIADYAKKIPSALVNMPAAQVYLESGQPAAAREIANRTLRLTGLQPTERVQLEMLVASCYAQEGKRQKSVKLLNEIRSSVDDPSLDVKERADLLMNMGRMQFFLGRYVQAAELFYEASKLYRKLGDWEAAAKTIFNTAACHLNGGTHKKDEAFAMIEECRRLAEAKNLPGPLAHCEAAYGMDAYQEGDFAAAREHFRRALEHLPISDKSYRRLHILSMLSYTYLAMGRYHLARKFGSQTFDLAALDESERNKSRYATLKAELMWEDGQIDESQELLRNVCHPFESHGVHTLEELSTLTRFNLQSALLNYRAQPAKFEIDDALKKNSHNWLDRQFSLGQLTLNTDDYQTADKHFVECLTRGRQMGDRYHEAIGLLGLIQSLLRQRRAKDLDAHFRDFEIVVGRLGESPLKSQVLMIHAARAYQLGDFAECDRILRQAMKSTRLSFADKFVISGWVATIEGRSSRLTSDWQTHMMARFTRTYFAPTLEAIDERHFRVSDHYTVSLERHPSLADLLHYLLLKPNFSASTAEIQTHVWKQSLQTQGWQQKIRNTIMRLRDFFPYTIAPIIVHSENISLFRDALTIHPPRPTGIGTEEEIVRLLADSPMSSTELAQRLKISSATTKRILKRLTDEHAIHPIKQGRNVFYSAASQV